jgi:hypothetical protein
VADPIEGTATAGGHAAKGSLDFLKQKVGPLPLGVWLLVAAVVLLYFERQKSNANPTSAANQQTDPAGNVGTIDPATGYVSGSPEDSASLAADNGGSTGTGSAGTNATTGAQTYADNEAWGIAAVNYLVGLGIDATTANQAVQNYLASQNLTTAQQGDVNLAIQALGAPPSLPGPTASNPTPVTGGGTTVKPGGTTPTVSGGHVVSVSATRAVVAWTGTGASSWQVKITGPGKINGQSDKVTKPEADYAGLQAGHDYTVEVQPLINGKAAGTPGEIEFKTTGGTAATTGKK